MVHWPNHNGLPALHVPALLLSLALGTCSAQVVLDGKFGTSGPIAGPNYGISSDLGAIRGNNLFHSFTQFDVRAGEVATFTGPANIQIQNILSRVTGGSASTIDGTLRSGIAGANFYFINPSGVIFGPNAAVDVSGSFAVSTANYLKLADEAKFVAALDADDSLLSSAPVAAFGFLDGAAGAIEVRGSLRSELGTPLTVIGSSVLVADGAHLEAGASQITLKGVSAPGEVAPVIPPSIIGGSSGNGNGEPKPGTVVIRGGRLVVENARVDVSATGGDIQLNLSDSVEVANGGQITTTSSGATKGGDIIIESPSVLVDGLDGPLLTRIAAETFSEDPLGAGGDVLVRSDSVELRLGGEISVSTYGAADAGRVEITTRSLRMRGSEFPLNLTQISANAAPIIGGVFGAGGEIVINADSIQMELASISASTLGDADAGSVDITAGSMLMNNGAITTYSSAAGDGGDIHIQSGEMILDGPFASITALTLGLNSTLPAGRGGLIDIQVGSLRMLNDSAISGNTYGDGAGGNIQIVADSVVLDTGHPLPGIIPGISSSSNPSFDGVPTAAPGGDITLDVGSLAMRNGMLISTTTATPGKGGNIEIRAGSITLDTQSSIQSASEGVGVAGTISMSAAASVLLSGASSISTSALQSSGGDIHVSSGTEVRLTDSQITAQAGPGGGGNITVNAPDMVYLLDSTFTAQAEGDGGNLTIENPEFILLNESALISKSTSANGGNISILSDFFFQSESIIDASAPFGIPGTVSVTAPAVDLHGSLIALPGSLLGAETQLRPDCAVRLSGEVSSFIVLGRGGLPIQPGGLVPSGAAASWNDN
jgi:filamentous hemagglutinin family protein